MPQVEEEQEEGEVVSSGEVGLASAVGLVMRRSCRQRRGLCASDERLGSILRWMRCV